MIHLVGKIFGICGLFALAMFWTWCLSQTPTGSKKIVPLDVSLFILFVVCGGLGFLGLVTLALT